MIRTPSALSVVDPSDRARLPLRYGIEASDGATAKGGGVDGGDERDGRTSGSAEAVAAQAREALVLSLLREARIAQGQAARLLGMTRYDILDPTARDRIPSRPQTAEEMRQDLENARRSIHVARSDARRQRR